MLLKKIQRPETWTSEDSWQQRDPHRALAGDRPARVGSRSRAGRAPRAMALRGLGTAAPTQAGEGCGPRSRDGVKRARLSGDASPSPDRAWPPKERSAARGETGHKTQRRGLRPPDEAYGGRAG